MSEEDIKIRKRTSSTIPFGWQSHPENNSLLVENEKETAALNYIRSLKGSHSLRTLTTVLKARTGRDITPRGMQKILERDY